MNRVAKILIALVVWGASSGLLLFICVFSVNQTIIYSALIIAAVALIGGALAFATKHDKTGLVIAAIPALVIAGLMVMFIVIGFSEYHR